MLFKLLVPQASAILVLRDVDDQPCRHDGLDQARIDGNWPFAVVVGCPDPKRECWLLAGFVPEDSKERQRLGELRKELGFNPCERPEELTAKGKDAGGQPAKRSAKRVLEKLTLNDPEREARCWQEMDLEQLAANGVKSGLSDYLTAVETQLVPLLRGARP